MYFVGSFVIFIKYKLNIYNFLFALFLSQNHGVNSAAALCVEQLYYYYYFI